MVENIELKVLVLGNSFTHQHLKLCLETSNFDVTYLTQCLEALERLRSGRFNIALVEGWHAEALRACREIYSGKLIPVALLVRSPDLNWQNYGSWQVDGFITEESTSLELIARMKAIARRPVSANASLLRCAS